MKTCSTCKIEKPLDAFNKRANSPDGFHNHCRICTNEKKRIKSEKIRRDAAERKLTSKVCRLCEQERDISLFRASSSNTSGYDSRCRDCVNRSDRVRYAENPEKYRKKLQEKRDGKRDRYRAYDRKYNKMYPEKGRAKANLRRAREIQRTPPWSDLEAIKAKYKQALMIEAHIGVKMHVDHIIPLKGKRVSGLHVPENLQILNAHENMLKSNKFEV